jgi:hypothetical protein
MRNSSTGAWYLFPLNGRSVTKGVNLGTVPMAKDTAWQLVQVEDFTGDGKVDVLLRNEVTNAWYLYPLDGRTLLGGSNQGDVNLTNSVSWSVQ